MATIEQLEQRVLVLEQKMTESILDDDPYQSSHTGPEIDEAVGRAKSGGEIDTLLAGKAPAGYGLGPTQKVINNTDIDTLFDSGFYTIGSGCTNVPAGTDQRWSGLFVMGGRACTQIYRPANGESSYFGSHKSLLIRIYKDGTEWSPWEWVNPPMAAGIEYRTTERYLGKPVYTKLVDCGVGPNATRKTVSAGISNVDRAVSANGSWGALSIPYEWFSGDSRGAQAINITLDGGSIEIASTADYSVRTIYALIKYTKTTD